MFKVNNKDSRATPKAISKLTSKNTWTLWLLLEFWLIYHFLETKQVSRINDDAVWLSFKVKLPFSWGIEVKFNLDDWFTISSELPMVSTNSWQFFRYILTFSWKIFVERYLFKARILSNLVIFTPLRYIETLYIILKVTLKIINYRVYFNLRKLCGFFNFYRPLDIRHRLHSKFCQIH